MKKNPKAAAPQRKSARPKASNTTIDDIAALAGVSTATVSRFFNSPGMLRAKTAQRVRDAVKRSGYVPNMVASELASNRSRLVATVIPSFAQSMFDSTIQALCDSLADQGYSVMLGLSGTADEQLHRQLLSIIGRRPDGIILTGTVLDPAARKLLRSAAIPTIETWDLPKQPIDLVVGLSHDAVGVAVARHVLARGRRRTLMLSATGVRALARQRGFSRTLHEAGMPEPDAITFAGASTFADGRGAIAAHLRGGGRPDIVVCSSDLSAHGAIHELQQRGLRVPADVAVIGFGDLPFSRELTPALTTVKIDGAKIGQQAVRFLMQRARGERIEHPIVDIGFSLIVRDSG